MQKCYYFIVKTLKSCAILWSTISSTLQSAFTCSLEQIEPKMSKTCTQNQQLDCGCYSVTYWLQWHAVP